MGRPRAKIDREQLMKLAERGWSKRQIGAFFRVDESVIRDRFSRDYEIAQHGGAGKLVDVLWQRALGTKGLNNGSDRVLIHLSDRILGPVKREMNLNIENMPPQELQATGETILAALKKTTD